MVQLPPGALTTWLNYPLEREEHGLLLLLALEEEGVPQCDSKNNGLRYDFFHLHSIFSLQRSSSLFESLDREILSHNFCQQEILKNLQAAHKRNLYFLHVPLIILSLYLVRYHYQVS